MISYTNLILFEGLFHYCLVFIPASAGAYILILSFVGRYLPFKLGIRALEKSEF